MVGWHDRTARIQFGYRKESLGATMVGFEEVKNISRRRSLSDVVPRGNPHYVILRYDWSFILQGKAMLQVNLVISFGTFERV